MGSVVREVREQAENRARRLQQEAVGEVSFLHAEIAEGRFQRGLAIAAAVFAVLNGGEAYFEHLRGSFSQRWMWTPIWLSPFMAGAGVGAYFSPAIARRVLPVVSLVTLVEGVIGFFLHLRGISRMAGHFRNLQFNISMGPPLFAPLLFCSVGFLGVLASLMKREGVR